MLTVTWCCSEYCVPTRLNFEVVGASVVHYYSSNYVLRGHWVVVNMTWALFCGKMWQNSKEHPLPLGRPVRCSAHGHSFVRLQYSKINKHSDITAKHVPSFCTFEWPQLSDVATFATYTSRLYFQGHRTPSIPLLFCKLVAIEKHASCSHSCSKNWAAVSTPPKVQNTSVQCFCGNLVGVTLH